MARYGVLELIGQAFVNHVKYGAGEACLHIAASSGHADVVRQLLRLGADAESREGLAGRTALHLAIEHRHREVIHILIHDCKYDIDTPTYAGQTAYHLAKDTDEKLAKELVRLGATPSLPPALLGDDESDEDDEDEPEQEEDNSQEMSYQMALVRLGIANGQTPAVTSA